MSPDDGRNRQADGRYEQAANDALQQLDWCIGYLHGIRKGKIASVLAKNRTQIKQSLMHQQPEPLPSEVTEQR